MKQARVELQKAREEAFKRVVGGEQMGSGLGSSPPPGYAPPSGPPPGYSE
jgi:hypothetical protein